MALGEGHGPENRHTPAAFPVVYKPDGAKPDRPVNLQITNGGSGPAASGKTCWSPGNGNWTSKSSSR